MSRKYWLPPVLGLVLTLLMLLLMALPATAQEPVSQPTLDVYFIRLQPLPEGGADLASSFQAAYDRLEPTLLELSADGQIAAYEYLPAIRSVRLIASQDAITRLASRPQVARIEPLHPQRPAPPATPATSEPDVATAEPTAAEAPLSPDAPPAKTVSEPPVLPPDSMPTALQGEIITYNWVNNQGANPPITYNWTEISNTGSIVAQGDDVFSQVQLGFPFTFYGTAYTDVFVSSNGFLSFGSGSSGFSHTSIPDPASPNNAVYAFWDDLNPSGGTNGNVFIKQISATRYVVEWYRVRRLGGNDFETFQIILDGADNTIMLQFQSVSGTGSSTVGVENNNGTVGTQVAYNASSVIFDGLAIKFTPTLTTVYTIAGTVRDDDTTPVSGARVAVTAGPTRPVTMSDASGRYSLIVIPGAYTLRAEKSGYFRTPERTATVPPDQVAVDLTFPRRYTIRGTVRNYDNTPVKDVSVSTDWDDPMHAYAQTDATGAYTLTVTAGAYTVGAYKSGYPDPADRVVTVPPDATGVDFAFPQPFPISGTVRDGSGQPMPGATVWGGVSSVTTAADGTYTAMAGPGDHYLSAGKDGYQSAPSVLVPVPPATTGVDFVLRVKDQTIRGRVVDNQGRPLADASVSANNIVCGNWGSASTRVAADGAYTLTVPSGSYHVTASKNGYMPSPPELAKVPVTDAQAAAVTVDFTLEPLAYTIRGAVRDSLGRPVEDAQVYAGACGLSYSADTDATGAYTLAVSANTYRVYTAKTDYGDAPAQTVATPPNADHVDFVLPPTYTISGRVTDPRGRPLAGVWVGTDYSGADSDSDSTDADGKYTLHLAAGSYRIGVEKDGYDWPRRTAAVPPDQTGVDFVLTPVTLRIQGVLRDTVGHGVAGGYVCPTLAGENSSFFCKTTYYNGAYSKLLPAGTYSVSTSASCYTYVSTSGVTLPPDRTGLDFTIRLRDQLIAGRTTDTDGQPVCGASVRANGSYSDSDSSARNGRYALQVPSGAYKVGATKSGYNAPPEQNVTVPPYATGINFVFQAPNRSTVQGAVRDRHGAGVAGVSIVAAGSNGSAATVTGPDGSYSLKVVDGTWNIMPGKVGYLAFPATRSVVTPPNRSEVDFTLIARSEIKSVYLPLLLRSR